jgi:lysophospholipase L1-like esterase
MNQPRISVIALVIAVVLFAGILFLRREPPVDTHRHLRQVVLGYTLRRSEHPIVILGDSITEASTLPPSLCGHALVNAGLGGASTGSDLGTWLLKALDGRRAATILVALGTNDALQGREQQEFETKYGSLLAQIKGAADHLAVLGIPAVEVRAGMTAEYEVLTRRHIDAFNAALPALAEKAGATFISLPLMGAPHTIDGVHLDAAGYAVWDAAVLKGASSACNPS